MEPSRLGTHRNPLPHSGIGSTGISIATSRVKCPGSASMRPPAHPKLTDNHDGEPI